ncbi:Ribosome maturation protein SBDS [Corchorus capsularis]|uniref:Ribosome maturation protein SBDS n=1 Tax=Corchorus capsularis TaxID=210143 RepID=A0A1R3JJK6_COCAP|nr:Ribosome maturation protein SBDS [Corchorus capsularis]
MSRTLVQPIGQKRLTNVAVVRLKKHGMRFEIACYKNKVLSWRSRVEKDLDEVLQSQTVYSNVSKGVLAKTKDLMAAFGTDDQTKICLEILEKGELQVAGKERESQFSSQFRDIATIVMQKTINPETQRPYTISMIERLMHEIHFAVDPNSSSKKQVFFSFFFLISFSSLFFSAALEVIRELQKNFPIKRSPMRLRLNVPGENFHALSEKLNEWSATIVSKDESGSELLLVCEIEPGMFRECDALVRNLQCRLEILAVSVHADGDTQVDYDEEDISSHLPKESADSAPSRLPQESTDSMVQLSEKMQKQTISSGNENGQGEVKQHKCGTCNAFVGDAKEYRDHFKSEWHKHNLKRKTRQLPPLSAEECLADMEMSDSKSDLQDYSF